MTTPCTCCQAHAYASEDYVRSAIKAELADRDLKNRERSRKAFRWSLDKALLQIADSHRDMTKQDPNSLQGVGGVTTDLPHPLHRPHDEPVSDRAGLPDPGEVASTDPELIHPHDDSPSLGGPDTPSVGVPDPVEGGNTPAGDGGAA